MVIFKSQNMCTVMLSCQFKGHRLCILICERWYHELRNQFVHTCSCVLPEHISSPLQKNLFRRKEKALQIRTGVSCGSEVWTFSPAPLLFGRRWIAVPWCNPSSLLAGAEQPIRAQLGGYPAAPAWAQHGRWEGTLNAQSRPLVSSSHGLFFQSCMGKEKVREGEAKRKSGQMSAGGVQ